MISTMDRANIISLHKIGHSNRKIAKELGIHRNTVNKTVNKYKDVFDQIINAPLRDDSYLTFLEMVNGGPKKKQERKKKTFSGRLKQRFEELLEDDNERNELLGRNKQQLNAAVLHRKLKAEGFNGSAMEYKLCGSWEREGGSELILNSNKTGTMKNYLNGTLLQDWTFNWSCTEGGNYKFLNITDCYDSQTGETVGDKQFTITSIRDTTLVLNGNLGFGMPKSTTWTKE